MKDDAERGRVRDFRLEIRVAAEALRRIRAGRLAAGIQHQVVGDLLVRDELHGVEQIVEVGRANVLRTRPAQRQPVRHGPGDPGLPGGSVESRGGQQRVAAGVVVVMRDARCGVEAQVLGEG